MIVHPRILTAAKDQFTVDPRTRHTYFKTSPPVEIEVLSPPNLFPETFNKNTPTHVVTVGRQSTRILKPALILNTKCRSILGRPTDKMKFTYATDIKFLLWWMGKNNAIPLAREVPNSSKGFVEWFIQRYEGAEYWTSAGYSLSRGKPIFYKL